MVRHPAERRDAIAQNPAGCPGVPVMDDILRILAGTAATLHDAGIGLSGYDRQMDAKACALAGFTLHINMPATVPDDAIDRR
jgi:hypothetical protein